MAATLASFTRSFKSGKNEVVLTEKTRSPYTITPDPDQPGMLKKCFNIADPDKGAREALQRSARERSGKGSFDDSRMMTGRYRTARLCNEPRDFYSNDELMEIYPNGIMSDSLVPEESSGRVAPSAIAGHVRNLQTAGVVKNPPTMRVGRDTETDMDKYIEEDNAMYKSMQNEYCHYNERYTYALKKFLSLATSRDTKDNPAAQDMLEVSRKLNIRVNSVLEVMNYVSQSRVTRVNANKADIDASNKAIRMRLRNMANMFKRISQDNIIVESQREMVRYTQEKNAYTSNQIAIWTALNVVALGTIFYVYRN